MNATFHTLSEAPTVPVEVGMDSARASTIAKPQKAFAVAFAVLAAALAGCAGGFAAGSHSDANGYSARFANSSVIGARPIAVDYDAGATATLR